MTTKMLGSSITLERERERERESNNTRNIATNVALVCTPKINILKRKKLVMY